MRRQVVPSIDKLYQEDFPKAFFQSALREEQRRAPFLERNVLNLLSSKTRQKKAMHKQIVSNTDKVCQ